MIGIKKAAGKQLNRSAQKSKNWEALYQDLYENAPDMYLSVDSATGHVIRCNRTFLKSTGYKRNEVIGRPIVDLYQPESRPVARQALKKFVTTGSLRNLEMNLKRKDGSALPISLNSSAVRDAQGRILHSRSILRDITGLKRMEMTLRNSEARFRAIADLSPDIISIFDREGRLVFNSAAAVKIHGYQAKELEGRSTFDFIHPEDRPSVTAAFSRLLKDDAEEVKVQYRYRNANGSYNWMEAIGRNELANPHINGIIAISRDITERKQAEESLIKSRKFIIETGKIGKVGGWEFDLHTGKQTWTEAVYDIHEVDRSYEPTVEKGIRFYTLASRPVIERAVKAAIEQRKPFDVELEIITAKGNSRWVKAIGKPDPKRHRIFGFFQDITERKMVEDALRESEARFRLFMDNSPTVAWVKDEAGRHVYISRAFEKQVGVRSNDWIGKTDAELWPPKIAAELRKNDLEVLAAGRPRQITEETINPDGSTSCWLSTKFPFRDGAGRRYVAGIGLEITERKRAEDAARNYAKQLEVLVQTAPAAIVIHGPDGKLLQCNAVAEKLLGMAKSKAADRGLKDRAWHFLREDGAPMPVGEYPVSLVLRTKAPVSNYICGIEHIGKKTVWVLVNAQPRFSEDGSLADITVAFIDITHRKQMEESLRQLNATLEQRVLERTAALQKSEARFQQIAANIKDVLYMVDSASHEFSYVSPVFEQMLGYTLDDITNLGGREKFLANVIQGGQFEKQRVMFRKLQKNQINTAIQYQTWWRCKDGSLKFIEDLSLPVYSAGRLQYTYGALRDITERVRLEQEVLNISDWESRRIAQDLHDGLGQLLVGAGFLVDALRKDLIPIPDYAARRLNRIQEAIHLAGKQARDLARGVQPVEPESNGLMTALAKLAEQTSEMFCIRCDFKCPRPVMIEDNQVATHLFRIAQESVTNAIKHGRAKRISLRLTRSPNQIILAINDDGMGLKRLRHHKTGMGLRIMNYRADLIRGTLTIKNKSDAGIMVTCRAPISGRKNR